MFGIYPPPGKFSWDHIIVKVANLETGETALTSGKAKNKRRMVRTLIKRLLHMKVQES